MKVGFIGWGQMGKARAQNLLTAGHDLTVYNRTKDKTTTLSQAGARVADSAAAVGQGAEIVFSMLANDEALEAVVFGPEHY